MHTVHFYDIDFNTAREVHQVNFCKLVQEVNAAMFAAYSEQTLTGRAARQREKLESDGTFIFPEYTGKEKREVYNKFGVVRHELIYIFRFTAYCNDKPGATYYLDTLEIKEKDILLDGIDKIAGRIKRQRFNLKDKYKNPFV